MRLLPRWPFRLGAAPSAGSGAPAKALAPVAPAFDAVLALGPELLPPGVAPGAAVQAVRAAVQAMPGAGWVAVEAHGLRLPPGLGWVELHTPGGGTAPEGRAWSDLRAGVERVATAALAGVRAASELVAPELGAPEAAAPAFGGFAEGVDRHAFEVPAGISRAEPPAGPGHNAGPGAAASDAALLGTLLSLVLPQAASGSAAALAEVVVGRFGSFAAVLAASERELRAVPGLGTHCIAAIKLLHDAALRLAQAGVAEQSVLGDRTRLLDYLHAVLSRERIEQFRILFLDAEGRLVADEAQARGTVNHTPVYPREVVKRALELGAASLILVHNHPSGDPEPSREDVEMTGQVCRAAELLGVRVEDHLIVGNGRWTSLREQGLM